MAGRGDRDQVGDRVDAVLRGRSPGWSGSGCSQNVGAEVPGVEPHVRVAGLVHPAGDRLGDHVARREVGELVHALHEAVALEVDEEGALAAHRLGDQRLLAARVGAEVHHRRVELHELQVAQRRARPAARRAIPSPVETAGLVVWAKTWPSPPLASTTARQRTAPTPSRWPSPITCRVTPGDARRAVGVEQQVDGERVLDDLDLGRPLDRGDQRALDLGAGRVAAGVRDPVAVVAALAGQRQLAVGAWSKLVPSAISSRTASGPSVTRTRTASGRRRRRRRRGCRLVLAGVSPGPSAAAMPPCAHWVEPAASTSLVTTRSLSPVALVGARRSARRCRSRSRRRRRGWSTRLGRGQAPGTPGD